MTDIQVGDEVLVFFNHHQRFAADPGEVVRVGRTRCTIRVHSRDYDFQMESQQMVGEQRGYGVYFKTPEQQDGDDRKAKLKEVMHEAGLEFRTGYERGSSLPLLEAIVTAINEIGTD